MKLAFAEVFETATFYAHFDVVKEGEPDIAPLTIRVCDSLTCAMLGAEKLLHELQDVGRPRHPRGARALRRAVRYRAGGRGRPSFRRCTRPRRERAGDGQRAARPIRASRPTMSTTTPMSPDGGYRLLNDLRAGAPRQGRHPEGARRCQPARARRRRLSDGAQMARGARRARAAADGGQWRRGRARHLQGSLLSADAIRTASSRAC